MGSDEQHMEEIRRNILEKLFRRLAGSGQPLGNLRVKPVTETNTDRFDRVLALWIDVQRAIHLRESHDAKPEGRTLRNCRDNRVRAACEALTNPKNVLALESLCDQLPEGPQMDMARKACKLAANDEARRSLRRQACCRSPSASP